MKSPGSGPPPDVHPTSGPPTDEHFPELAAYVLGSLDADAIPAFEQLISQCPSCQEELPRLQATVTSLDRVPAEFLLDGPPDDADLLIRRTVRRIRAEQRQPRRAVRRDLSVAAAVVLLVGGAAAIGRETAPTASGSDIAAASAVPPSLLPTPVPGTRQAEATDQATGASLTVKVVPAAGWVRITAATSGIKQGQQCRLVVVSRQNTTVEAGSWLVSSQAASDGTTVEGAALVAPDDVAAVRVETTAGQVLVSTAV